MSIGMKGITAPHDREIRAPASGMPCVFWRLRIVETVAPALTLIHDVTSNEPFLIDCGGDDTTPSRRLQVPAADARVSASTVLHREGSPGALAIARSFGLIGQVRVEESYLRPGERVEARGFLLHPDTSAGPFRAVAGPIELLEAEVRALSKTRAGLLLPLAIGTGAIVIATLGTVAALVRLFDHGRTLAAPSELRMLVAPTIDRAIPARPRWP